MTSSQNTPVIVDFRTQGSLWCVVAWSSNKRLIDIKGSGSEKVDPVIELCGFRCLFDPDDENVCRSMLIAGK